MPSKKTTKKPVPKKRAAHKRTVKLNERQWATLYNLVAAVTKMKNDYMQMQSRMQTYVQNTMDSHNIPPELKNIQVDAEKHTVTFTDAPIAVPEEGGIDLAP